MGLGGRESEWKRYSNRLCHLPTEVKGGKKIKKTKKNGHHMMCFRGKRKDKTQTFPITRNVFLYALQRKGKEKLKNGPLAGKGIGGKKGKVPFLLNPRHDLRTKKDKSGSLSHYLCTRTHQRGPL